MQLPGVSVHAPPNQMVLSEDDAATVKTSRPARRLLELITSAAAEVWKRASAGRVWCGTRAAEVQSSIRSGHPHFNTVLALLKQTPRMNALQTRPDADRSLYFQFYRSPVEVMVDASGAAEGVRVRVGD